MSKSNVIILDEFTSALDKSSALDIYQFLNSYIINNNITCINITHNLSDIEYMPGELYHFESRKIRQFPSKDLLMNAYIKGEIC